MATFKTAGDFIEYRLSMKAALREIGCDVGGYLSTNTLEEMIRINNLEV